MIKQIGGTLSAGERLSGALSPQIRIDAKLNVPTNAGIDTYDGPFVVTPSTRTQTLNTAEKYLAESITIKPIPSNYGLITWNGSSLTVS